MKLSQTLTIVVFKLLNEAASSIVKHVDAAIVETGQNPRPMLVETKPLDSLTLGLVLYLHHLSHSDYYY